MRPYFYFGAAILVIIFLPVFHQLHASPAGTQYLPSAGLFQKGPGQTPAESVDEREKRSNAPVFRFGASTMALLNLGDEDLAYYYDLSFGFFADYIYFRWRSRSGNGIDLYGRFTYRLFWTSNDKVEEETDLIYKENRMNLFSLDPGVRLVFGFYFFGQLWQPYILIAPRILYYYLAQSESRYGDDDTSHHLGSIGVTGGAGIEMTLTKDAGVFAEYNYGYTPVGENNRNVDGHQVYFGATWRTFLKQY